MTSEPDDVVNAMETPLDRDLKLARAVQTIVSALKSLPNDQSRRRVLQAAIVQAGLGLRRPPDDPGR